MPPFTRERAAEALGMLPAEVVNVDEQHDPHLGGYRVELHDGTRAVVHDNGLITVHTTDLADRWSPATHALNPCVRLADLSAVFGEFSARAADAAEAFEQLREQLAVAEDQVEPDPGTGEPVVSPPFEPVEPPVEPVEPPVEPSPVDPAEVPAGSAEAVLAWVGDDQDRARAALAAEGERDKGPRAGLSRELAAILTPAPGGGDE
jgi:hypothetical protein